MSLLASGYPGHKYLLPSGQAGPATFETDSDGGIEDAGEAVYENPIERRGDYRVFAQVENGRRRTRGELPDGYDCAISIDLNRREQLEIEVGGC